MIITIKSSFGLLLLFTVILFIIINIFLLPQTILIINSILRSYHQFIIVLFHFNKNTYYIFITSYCYYCYFITILVLVISIKTFADVFQLFLFSLQFKLGCVSISDSVLILFVFCVLHYIIIITVCNYILKVHFWIIFPWLIVCTVLLLNLCHLLIM